MNDDAPRAASGMMSRVTCTHARTLLLSVSPKMGPRNFCVALMRVFSRCVPGTCPRDKNLFFPRSVLESVELVEELH